MASFDSLTTDFEQLFGASPRIFRAPGRVNMIGEHTDYNEGFVMPAAIAFETRVAIAQRADRVVRVYSCSHDETVTMDLDEVNPQATKHWSDYVFGTIVILLREGYALKGADLMIASTVPMGAGLSSSAALEVSVGYAMLALADQPVDTVELAKLCQKAENEFVGMRCGIMDQFISANGIEDHALMLDCRTLETRQVPIDSRARIVVANSMVHHAHAGGEYNKRRQSCEEGLAAIKTVFPEVQALRDVSPVALEAHKELMSEETFRRCRHITTENERVLEAVAALRQGDLKAFGEFMDASHASMRDDYEISCPEIDRMVDIAQAQRGVYGSRMTGGGFGGCTVSLVDVTVVDKFMADLARLYKEATGLEAMIFACSPMAGAGPLETVAATEAAGLEVDA